MATKKLKKIAEIWVPQSRDETADAIKTIGDTSREIERLTVNMNDEIADVTKKYQATIDRHKQSLDTLQTGVQIWCQANRNDLTQGGKNKTANLITGTVHWRKRPSSISLRGIEGILEALKRMKLTRFIRSKEEINKEAMLNEPNVVSSIPGVKVVPGVEDFIIQPFEQDVT
ncbi:MAG: host-nuclease inhibitor Gam family protein [Burkholderiaceae bacterium]|jgi:phage host-nuclease inhibitor protein Gam|nr:host-nuclease inhibitor Gam family protein [Burkholderiaceae bacterium]